MADVLAAQLNDGVVAVVLAFALSTLFAAIAWTLKQALAVSIAVKGLEQDVADHERRLGHLEVQR